LMIKVHSVEEMEELGERVGSLLGPGDVVILTGELGSGKTAFCRGLGRGLGVSATITSPSFTLINEYEGRIPFYHLDVYRLDGPSDLEELGYEDYFYGEGVAAVEWGDKVRVLLPEEYLEVRLEVLGEGLRSLEFIPHGPRLAKVVEEVIACGY
jgi:tRNA threonylcarbamoyladenosine biosynthesis protein TsaE